MNEIISDEEALEACLGKKPASMDLKVIDHLDDGAVRWIAGSALAVVSRHDGTSPAITLAGGDPGFAVPTGQSRLQIATEAFDDPGAPRVGDGFGALFLVPGIGETLRVNGHVAAIQDGQVLIKVDECFMHCAKALIRSNLWQAEVLAETPDEVAPIIGATRLMFLGTTSPAGAVDVSPKGDPAGSLIYDDGDDLWFAERPGNRRADSLRNLLLLPRFAAILLVPGSDRIAVLCGTAEVTSRPDIRQRLAVQGKMPAIATRLRSDRIRTFASPSLARARLWSAPHNTEIDPAAVMTAHVRLNRTGGLQAKIARTLVSVPGLVRSGLAADYKRNLY